MNMPAYVDCLHSAAIGSLHHRILLDDIKIQPPFLCHRALITARLAYACIMHKNYGEV